MRHLNLWKSRSADRLVLSFEAAFDSTAPAEDELGPIFEILEKHAGEWMPDVVEGKRERKYSRNSVWKAFNEMRRERVAVIGLCRTQEPALDMSLHLSLPPLPSDIAVLIYIDSLPLFAEEEPCSRLVEMVREWALRYPTSHAFAHSSADNQLSGAPSFGRDNETVWRDGFDKVYEFSWLNVFGSKLVETVGRERVLSTPAHLVEELPNGSVLLVLRPTPADFASEEARVAQARAHVHLRPELDFDTVLRTLRERSAALAPVEPRFHPDLAPLLSRLPFEFAISERQRKIAELNAFRPPEPEEWLPAALPSDVENPERVLSDYDDLSEGLVAALHTKVPSIFDETPESLTDLDFYFWKESFPKRYLRDLIDSHTAPALGAYLGRTLVRRLGGTWVLRQKLEESQVRVGQRVWLPFLRARRYMQSCEALLDYSLTQFFREAERHRG
ncbi:hypothetical protein D7X99_07610 [Corallococcus sp. AB032C]|uniref:hypothetical protein n=1 Tax=Corallococcus TaxID=83461 RepID=UPI000ED966F1|nr:MULTISPECIES: hypothetical protein [Corallococcus]NNB91627.1 hypothetical protein [Corallococcus exiguus]NPC52888.1 hypothetical protein [Corallococcus exiguus]RKH84971.1 hypothetical protein D7X99_07610 [Corallococcus sp. AB032C]